MTGETAHRSTAATKEVNGPGIIWHIPRPTRNEKPCQSRSNSRLSPRVRYCRSCGDPAVWTRGCTRVGQLRRHVSAGHHAGEGSLDVRDDFTLDRDTIAVTWGNANPLIVEIGTGQGENIVAAAAAHPDATSSRWRCTTPASRTRCCSPQAAARQPSHRAGERARTTRRDRPPAPSPRSGRSSPTLGRR